MVVKVLIEGNTCPLTFPLHCIRMEKGRRTGHFIRYDGLRHVLYIRTLSPELIKTDQHVVSGRENIYQTVAIRSQRHNSLTGDGRCDKMKMSGGVN